MLSIVRGTKGVPRRGVWTSVRMRVWTCEELRVKRDQTSCCLRPPILGTPLVPSRSIAHLLRVCDDAQIWGYVWNTRMAKRIGRHEITWKGTWRLPSLAGVLSRTDKWTKNTLKNNTCSCILSILSQPSLSQPNNLLVRVYPVPYVKLAGCYGICEWPRASLRSLARAGWVQPRRRYDTMLCYTMLCYAILCYAML